MTTFRGFAGGCLAVLALLSCSGATEAAWYNVFQVCCHNCRPRSVSAYQAPAVSFFTPSVSFAAPSACCTPCPQQVCTTQYVQRSFYQPVTTTETRCCYEPVTSYQTSYYWEPVCSYRFSCFFDPCTCTFQQVATPVTSYRLRSQCNAVTSYVQRCYSQPVTTWRQSFYLEPVTTCCTTTTGAPIMANGSAAAPQLFTAPNGNGSQAQQYLPPTGNVTPPPPGVSEQRGTQQPGVSETPGNGTGQQPWYNRSYPPQETAPPPGASSRQQPLPPAPVRPAAPPPRVRLDRIVAVPSGNVQGQVVRAGNAPVAGAKVTFARADRSGPQQEVTADAAGKFQATLTSGSWVVSVKDGRGVQTHQGRLEIRGEETRQVTLLSQ